MNAVLLVLIAAAISAALFSYRQKLRRTAGRAVSLARRVLFDEEARFTVVPDAKNWSQNTKNADKVTYFTKDLFVDPSTGDGCQLIRYPAGQTNPKHRHSIGHAIYVLEGTLVTHRGSFGKGNYVWFPPNEVMTHGAGPDADMVGLFMTKGALDTTYLADP